MTLTRKRMVSEVGRRTRLKNREVQLMLEALINLWAEELAAGGRIELENLLVLEVKTIDRGEAGGVLASGPAPRYVRRVVLRVSKRLKAALGSRSDG